MKYGRSLQELAIELDRQAKVKKDYVATAGAMQMTAVNENFDLVIGNTPFQLNENAHRQLGLQLKIPAPYYERMRAENPGLLMANVNGWFQQSPDTRRMVRTLDGTARAILSDRYRRIDNYEVAQTVLPIISEMQGARIESCELTDTRMYIKVVNERIQTEVEQLTDTLAADQSIALTYAGEFHCTAYCSEEYPHICGEGQGITSSGAKVQPGVTVAADTSIFPYGTVILIEGVGMRVVQDTGSLIKENTLDVAVGTHAEAISWSGWGSHKVWIVTGGETDAAE